MNEQNRMNVLAGTSAYVSAYVEESLNIKLNKSEVLEAIEIIDKYEYLQIKSQESQRTLVVG